MTRAQQPEDIPKLFIEAWEARDAVALASLFAEDADFINVTGLHWNSREQIQKVHDYGLRVIFADSVLRLRNLTVRYLGTDAAVVHAHTELMQQTTPDGAVMSHRRKNRFVFVVQRVDDGWLCVSAQNTEVLPGAETFVIEDDGTYRAVSYGRFS